MVGEEGDQGVVEVQQWWESQWSWEGGVVEVEELASPVLNL